MAKATTSVPKGTGKSVAKAKATPRMAAWAVASPK